MTKKIGNGVLKLPMWQGRFYTVYGGPYTDKPRNLAGVKMAKEITAPATVRIDTPDFHVPPIKKLNSGLLKATRLIIARRKVYVGCMAGRGRTGLFLAILAKAWGIPNPVEYVREHYFSHAVETKPQYDFVTNYEVPERVLKAVKWARFTTLLSFKKNLSKIEVA